MALVAQVIGHTSYNWALGWVSPSLVAVEIHVDAQEIYGVGVVRVGQYLASEQVDVPDELREKVTRLLRGAYFGLVCEVVDAGHILQVQREVEEISVEAGKLLAKQMLTRALSLGR